MPAKTLADLPPDATIEVRTFDNGEVQIMALDDQNEPYHLPGEEMQLLGITLERRIDPVTEKMACRSVSCYARDGFGPLAYDLAMECASVEGGGGLFTGAGLNENSKPVWEFYRDNRPDVTRTNLAPDHPWLKTHVCDPKFPFFLTKDMTLLPELKDMGKIKFVEGSADLVPQTFGHDEIVDEQLKKCLGGDE